MYRLPSRPGALVGAQGDMGLFLDGGDKVNKYGRTECYSALALVSPRYSYFKSQDIKHTQQYNQIYCNIVGSCLERVSRGWPNIIQYLTGFSMFRLPSPLPQVVCVNNIFTRPQTTLLHLKLIEFKVMPLTGKSTNNCVNRFIHFLSFFFLFKTCATICVGMLRTLWQVLSARTAT